MKRFHKIFLGVVFITLSSNTTNSQSIRFENPDYRHSKIIFASHHGDAVYKINEVTTDLNGFTLIFNNSLESGIYYLIMNDSSSIEWLYDNDFPGKISISKNKELGNYIVDGPKPTMLYSEYLNTLKQEQPQSPLKPNSLLDEYIAKDDKSFLSVYLKSQKNIKIPKYKPAPEITNKDSAIWYNNLLYYQEHYLDNIDLSDTRLINTPIYTSRINDYLNKISGQEPIKQKDAIDKVIAKTGTNNTAQEFLANYLLSKFGKRRGNPSSEYIYVHLIKKYYLTSGFKWITDEQINSLTIEYNRHFPASLFQKAPNFTCPTPDENLTELHRIENDYLILYFYDYDCKMCEHSTPKLNWIKSVYNYLDIDIVAVCLGEDKTKWKKYISHQGMTKWKNLHDCNNKDKITNRYNIRYTPTIFVLDKEKNIIAKNLNTKQLENFFFELAINRNKKT